MKKQITEHQKILLQMLSELDRICKKLSVPYVLFAGTAIGAARHKGFIPWDDDIDVAMLREDYDRFLRLAGDELDGNVYYLQKEFSEHWPMFFSKLRRNNTTCIERFIPKDDKMHQGIYVDIFPVDNLCASSWRRKLQFIASKVVIAKSLDRRGYITNSWKKKFFMFLCKFIPLKPMLSKAKCTRCKETLDVHTFFAAASKYEKNVFERRYFTERVAAMFEGVQFPVSVHNHEMLTKIYGDYMVLPSAEEVEEKIHGVIVDTKRSYEHYLDEQKKMKITQFSKSIR